MMRFRDRKHQIAVQAAEKQDQAAQQLIQEFCELINFGYQQQQGLFAVGYYQSVLPVAPMRMLPVEGEQNLPRSEPEPESHVASASAPATAAEGELEIEPDLDMGIDDDVNNNNGGNNSNNIDEAASSAGRVVDEHLGPDDLDLEVDLSDLSDVSGHEHDQQQRPPHA
jgi:hypothetical protein